MSFRPNEKNPKVLIIAGEASGDLHGSNLVRAMKRQVSDLDVFGIGGDRMAAVGVRLIYHSSEVNFLGFVEVIRHLPFIRKMMQRMLDALQTEQPDLVVLIDYPGFNLRYAERIRKLNLPQMPAIFYYISPQVWAWHQSRVPKIAQLVDRMAVIFPFEVEIYEKVGLDTHFVGHPLLETLKITMNRLEFCRQHDLNPEQPILGLLPGSRRQEIERLLPVMIASVQRLSQQLPEVQFVLGVAETLPTDLIPSYLASCPVNITLVAGQNYEMINAADVMLVKSGTSTLETAIIGTPMIIIYKVNWLSYTLARLLVRIPNIGMANVVAGKRVVPELVQHQANVENIAALAHHLLTHPEKRQAMRQALEVVQTKLGDPGASDNAARLALELIDD